MSIKMSTSPRFCEIHYNPDGETYSGFSYNIDASKYNTRKELRFYDRRFDCIVKCWKCDKDATTLFVIDGSDSIAANNFYCDEHTINVNGAEEFGDGSRD